MSEEEEENETETMPFMTPVVKDDEGRQITRTMRRSDKLQDLTDFYYAMVPTVPYGKGVFLCTMAIVSTASERRWTTGWRTGTRSTSSSRSS
ncbi:hypothetical protein PR202_gb21377 [Eleusine coracana subsp. coracana]|uniref:Uncharacterized protein n=1 Tax=Eleusine coracana subsp. coracana TaxID=191504 RepID=A0AAV5FD43_ELECO|nr:hypothetical protein PR202_gb21377 [Eleusine coracana subsp. coracana]